jgi:hypothetical protein
MRLARVPFYVFYSLVAVWTFWPIGSILFASEIAAALSCTVNEGGAGPCRVLGYDIGQLLYGCFVAGWTMFATVPTGLALLLVVAVFHVYVLWRRRSRAHHDLCRRDPLRIPSSWE